jgi:hypothetical protein
VFQALGGGDVVLRSETPTGLHIRGGASDQTAWALDGIPVFSPYHAAGTFSAWNPEALASLQLFASSPPSILPAALSGVVSAVTRAPGAELHAQGSFSTTQMRVTVDGPLTAGAGYLLSLRSGYPGVLTPKQESSYLRGETGDALVKLEAPVLGGRLRLLGYQNANELDAAALAATDTSTEAAPRNSFQWQSESLGGEWSRTTPSLTVRLRAWRAASRAAADWLGEDNEDTRLRSSRRDAGVLAVLERSTRAGAATAGFRLEQSRTSYRVRNATADSITASLAARTPMATAFAEYTRDLGTRNNVHAALSVTTANGDVLAAPRLRWEWKPAEPWLVSLVWARAHQFAQSLRNAESIVGSVFPADLFAGANGRDLPVARSDQGVLAAEFRPMAGLRIGAHLWARRSAGLLLVAPRDGEPFLTRSFARGQATARGLVLDAAFSTARVGALATWGWQRVRLEHNDSSYVPEHGTVHTIDAGATWFAAPTFALRAGVAAAFGRRSTALPGAFEWEACNLLDAGCEFAGSPHYGRETPGAARLPAYVRVDAGLRKHWHLEVAGRDATLALFGTVTNVFARRNVLTFSRDAATGAAVPVEMRPLAPLVLGLDWRF